MSRVYAVPLLLAVASLIGLIAALIGDGVWDAVSWAALGAPLAVGLWLSLTSSGTRRA